MPITALTMLIKYWKPLAGVLAVVVFALYMYKWGSDNRQAEWDASVQLQKDIVQAEKDKLQARADKVSKDYQNYRKRTLQRSNTIKEGLAHEISNTAALRDCNATGNVVRLYDSTSDVLPANSP